MAYDGCNFVSRIGGTRRQRTGRELFEAGNMVVRLHRGRHFALGVRHPAADRTETGSDVLLTLVPLVIAGVVTLELCVVSAALNFANIIALRCCSTSGWHSDLLHPGIAGRPHLAAAILPDAGRVFQRHDHCDGLRGLWLSSDPASSMGQLMALLRARWRPQSCSTALMGPPQKEPVFPPPTLPPQRGWVGGGPTEGGHAA
jgi:hypothetical protein